MLALWEYFWDWGAGGSASAVVVLSIPTSGGGGEMRVYPFDMEQFFEVRELYLKRVYSAVEKETPSEIIREKLADLANQGDDGKVVANLVADRERAYRAAQVAQTAKELKGQAATITRLTLQLAEINARRDMDDQVILLLLLTE